MTATALLASIPSPHSGQLHIGPLRLTAYGLMIAIGVLAAVEIARRRLAARGGDPDDISAVAVWAVVAGLIGARIYHVLTDLSAFRGHWFDVVKIWNGGLGIPGGLIAGIGVGVLLIRRRGMAVGDALDVAAPALPVAQAIGRWGNWWNQELYGRPTSLPWALRIDEAHRLPGYEREATYHPAFLYECLWNLALAGFLVWFDRRYPNRLRRGSLFAMYVAGYGAGRLWVELLRIDPAQRIGGVRLNVLMSVVAVAAGVGYLLIWGGRPTPGPGETVAVSVGDRTIGGRGEPEGRGEPDADNVGGAAGARATVGADHRPGADVAGGPSGPEGVDEPESAGVAHGQGPEPGPAGASSEP